VNYSNHYFLLCDRAINRKLLADTYTEKHHIVPRCMGGDDANDNLVRLTPEEHYLAHQLLVKMFPGNHLLIYAVVAMSKLDHNGARLNNKSFGWIRRAHARVVGEQFSKKQSQEHIAKRADAIKATCASRERHPKPTTPKPEPKHPGKWVMPPMSEESREKKSLALKGKPWGPARRLAYEEKLKSV
jgi:hypothetical protein